MLTGYTNMALIRQDQASLNQIIEAAFDGFQRPTIAPYIKEAVLTALKNGADPGITMENGTHDEQRGNTPLLLAILYNDQEFAKQIISLDEKRVSINQRDKRYGANNTPLIFAIKKGWYDLASFLIDHGAMVDQTSGDEGFTPLHHCCSLLGIDYERQSPNALQHYFSGLFSYFQDDKTYRASEKLLALIHKLLENKANYTLKNIFGNTPLDLLNHIVVKEDFTFYNESREYVIAKLLGVDLKSVHIFNAELYEQHARDKSDEASPPNHMVDIYNRVSNRVKNFADIYLKNLDKEETINVSDRQKLSLFYARMKAYSTIRADSREKREQLKKDYPDIYEMHRNTRRYTIPELLRTSFFNVKTLDDINMLLESGTLINLVGNQDLGHASGHSDFTSVISATVWHRQNANGKSIGLEGRLLYNRQTFFVDFASQVETVKEKMSFIPPHDHISPINIKKYE